MADKRIAFESDGTVNHEVQERRAERTRVLKRNQIIIGATVAVLGLALVFWGLTRSRASQSATGSAPSGTVKSAAGDAPQTPVVTVTKVVAQDLERQLRLPGELQAYQEVAIYPRLQSFVEEITVDRGSAVRRGQLLVRMSAPELGAQRGEAEARARGAAQSRLEMESRVQGVSAQKLEAAAKLASDESTYKRLKAASETPGVVAENDVEVAGQTVEASRARLRSFEASEKAAQAQVRLQAENERGAREAARSVQGFESYLNITAPFDGVITERNAHKGSLASPSGGPPLLRLQQIFKLRLVVSVPEAEISGVAPGTRVNFTVPAFPGETFGGVVRRIGRALDQQTRTMPIELDVINDSGRLAPGMFAEVSWSTKRPRSSLFVPPSAVAATTERTFVVRIRDGVAEWVDVKRGVTTKDLVEVFGELEENDSIAVRGTDELRSGTAVQTKPAAAPTS